jgi:hypothetical protein
MQQPTQAASVSAWSPHLPLPLLASISLLLLLLLPLLSRV